jgi:hypothetical protein
LHSLSKCFDRLGHSRYTPDPSIGRILIGATASRLH